MIFEPISWTVFVLFENVSGLTIFREFDKQVGGDGIERNELNVEVGNHGAE